MKTRTARLTIVTLEITHTMTPDRHGTWVDALEKMAGGAVGISIAKTARRLRSAKNRSS